MKERYSLLLCLAGLLCAGLLLPGCSEQKLLLMDKSRIRPDDGDSFYYRGTAIRVLGMDTPEIRHEAHGIFEDQPYGREAARMTREIMDSAEKVEYIPCGKDKYGRTLAHVFVDGELLAVKLIRAGLAYETVSYYGDNGFPDLAAKILEAAKEGKKPAFDPPYLWKRKHQKKDRAAH